MTELENMLCNPYVMFQRCKSTAENPERGALHCCITVVEMYLM